MREFVEELKKLNIEIIKPSINKSFQNFRAINGKLFYGLGAIKNVGYEAISNIINEREKNGKFKSLVDFINRVKIKDVNKLQLEGLVKAGVFDEFDKDRNKIFNSIPKIIQQIKNINDDKDNHQANLFENQMTVEQNLNFYNHHLGNKKNYCQKNLNRLGFYLTNHPLNEYDDIFNQLNIISYNEFYDKRK